MGSFYHSLSIPRSVHREVEETVSAWLAARGFEKVKDEGILALDREAERGCLLLWDSRWTIVLFSHFEEEERLRLELDKLDLPLLHLWLHDSDLWGYELSESGRVTSAFNSNRRYFGGEMPAEAPNDAEALAQACFGDGSRAGELRALQKKKGVFMDPACDAFARGLGAAPAASQYQYAIDGETSWNGFSEARLRFRRPGFDPMHGFDLHRIQVADGPAAPVPAWKPSPGFRLFLGAVRFLFYPLTLYARWKIRRQLEAGMPAGEPGVAMERAWRVDGDFLVNEVHRCRISLAHGAAASRGPGILPFRVGPLAVQSQVRTGHVTAQILRNWAGREVKQDESFHVGDFPARFLASAATAPRPLLLYDFFIATPIAVYSFHAVAEEPPGEDVLGRLRATIETFEILAPAERG